MGNKNSSKKYHISDAIWIAWESHRRTIELCSFFDIPSFLFSSKNPRIVRHPLFIFRTLLIILQKRPKILFVQSPSLVLALMACFLKKIFGFKLVIDAHNAGLALDSERFRCFNFIFPFMQKSANLTIVTNDNLARAVASNGGGVFVLPDKIPRVRNCLSKKNLTKNVFVIVYICTFSVDEPYVEFLKAVEGLGELVDVYVTGNVRKISNDYASIKNLTFTGFLSEKDYWNLLAQADLVIDLTYREDCLLCGAYEAVSLGKPLLLSGTNALKGYFARGAVFAENNSVDIEEKIRYSIENIENLAKEVGLFKKDIESAWELRAARFASRLKCHD